MNVKDRYVMRDQVNDLVPSLMEINAQGHKRSRKSMTELGVFLAVTLGYLVLLSITL